MHNQNARQPVHPVPFVGRDELAASIERSAHEPAQGGSASGAPMLGLIVEAQSYNRYEVALAIDAGPGQPPAAINGERVVAINLAEPFDQAGQLAADTAVLLWPSQGLYVFARAAGQESTGEPPATDDYWAKVLEGDGPGYTVRRQTPDGDDGFTDADGAEDVSAANVWELTVDDAATADVPAGAVVRVWEEPDTSAQPQRFFFYAIHSVYR